VINSATNRSERLITTKQAKNKAFNNFITFVATMEINAIELSLLRY